jgi:signal transduction histidine kinase
MQVMHKTIILVFFVLLFSSAARPGHLPSNASIEVLMEQVKALQYDNTKMAFSLLSEARERAGVDPGPLLLAKLGNREATLHYISGNYDLALNQFILAREHGERAKAQSEIVYALNGRALIQMVDKEYLEALRLLRECVEINSELQDSLSLAKNFFNMGIAHDEMGQSDQSLGHLKQAQAFLSADSLTVLHLMVKNRMAKVYHKTGKRQQAAALYREVLATKSILTNWEKSFALAGLAELKLEQGEVADALNFGNEALAHAEIHGAQWDLQQITGLLSRIYQQLGKHELAFFHLKAHKAYSDSLYNDARNRQMARMELAVAKADNERLRAEKERDQALIQHHYKWMGFLVLIVVFLGGILYFFHKNLRLKNKFTRFLAKKNKAILEQKEIISRQNRALMEVNGTRTKILSIISHDLRSPINGLKQLLDIRKKKLLTVEEEEEVVSLLSHQIQQTESFLNDLLQWANTQMDGMVAQPGNVNVVEVVNTVLEHLDYQLKSKFLVVKHVWGPTNQHFAWVDTHHLKIILQNLLGNAIKFTPEYGKIRVFYTLTPTNIACHIEDSGTGINEAQQELINGQEDARIPSMVGTSNEKGTGLGLLLVKQFLALNGAKMDVASIPGLGTRFTLHFQRKPEEKQG